VSTTQQAFRVAFFLFVFSFSCGLVGRLIDVCLPPEVYLAFLQSVALMKERERERECVCVCVCVCVCMCVCAVRSDCGNPAAQKKRKENAGIWVCRFTLVKATPSELKYIEEKRASIYAALASS
jgi:hypothetical protein